MLHCYAAFRFVGTKGDEFANRHAEGIHHYREMTGGLAGGDPLGDPRHPVVRSLDMGPAADTLDVRAELDRIGVPAVAAGVRYRRAPAAGANLAFAAPCTRVVEIAPVAPASRDGWLHELSPDFIPPTLLRNLALIRSKGRGAGRFSQTWLRLRSGWLPIAGYAQPAMS